MKLISMLALLLSLALPTMVEAKTQVTLTKDNTLFLGSMVDGQTMGNLVQKAKELDARLPSQDPIYLVLDTPGGYIGYGLEAIDALKNINRPIHTISIFAASMGFHTVQGLHKRYMLSHGTLMSHKPRGGFYGEFPGQLDSRYMYYLQRIERMDKEVVARTNGKQTLKSYRDLHENEYWCEGQICVDQGFADEVVIAKCDKSLVGTHEVLWLRLIFFGAVIEVKDVMPDCPLTTGYLDYNIYIDGKPLYNSDSSLQVVKKKVENKTNKYSNYNYWGDQDTYTEERTKHGLTAEQIEKLMAEIKPKVEERRQQQQKRDVIKGY